jgi:hypothetical protein
VRLVPDIVRPDRGAPSQIEQDDRRCPDGDAEIADDMSGVPYGAAKTDILPICGSNLSASAAVEAAFYVYV